MPKGGYKALLFDGLPTSPEPLYYYSRLNPRQQRFVDNYSVSLDLQSAAKAAGYTHDKTVYTGLLTFVKVRCAIREKLALASAAAAVTAASLRRELKLIDEADPTELSGIWKVPCRHCWGINGQFQYSAAEMFYIEQAYDYGAEGWPIDCITSEFGKVVRAHADAAYAAAAAKRPLDRKGGTGYTRTKREINPNCGQCHGQGIPIGYVCDTRTLSPGGKALFAGVKIMPGERIEINQISKEPTRAILARDLQVGVERKELKITLPKTPDELREAIKALPDEELVQIADGMVTLGPDEYREKYEEPSTLPSKNKLIAFEKAKKAKMRQARVYLD